jgi:hypothetical protein
MKSFIPTAALILLTMVPIVQAEPIRDSAQRPCLNVQVQNDRLNRASVQQDCNRNVNRTVQAGADNLSQTIQYGETNSNKVRQYQYDSSKYLSRIRGN